MIKDSGERTEFSTGAVRDMSAGKGKMIYMPWIAILRTSRRYEDGAVKYGPYNYTKGIPLSSFIDSAMRHLAEYMAGMDDEDHLAAAAFNINGAMLMEAELPDMMDLPMREGKRTFPYIEAAGTPDPVTETQAFWVDATPEENCTNCERVCELEPNHAGHTHHCRLAGLRMGGKGNAYPDAAAQKCRAWRAGGPHHEYDEEEGV